MTRIAQVVRYEMLRELPKEVYDDLLERALNISDLGYSNLDLDSIMVQLHIKDIKNGRFQEANEESPTK